MNHSTIHSTATATTAWSGGLRGWVAAVTVAAVVLVGCTSEASEHLDPPPRIDEAATTGAVEPSPASQRPAVIETVAPTPLRFSRELPTPSRTLDSVSTPAPVHTGPARSWVPWPPYGDTDRARADRARADRARPAPVSPDWLDSNWVSPGSVVSGSANSGSAGSDSVVSGSSGLGSASSGSVSPAPVSPDWLDSNWVSPGSVVSGSVVSGSVVSGSVVSGSGSSSSDGSDSISSDWLDSNWAIPSSARPSSVNPASARPGSASTAWAHNDAVDDFDRGLAWLIEQRDRWDAEMPPYTARASAAFAAGEPVAERRGGTDDAFELVVDTDALAASGIAVQIRFSDDGTVAYDHVPLCPPYPSPGVLGVELDDDAGRRNRASARIEAVIAGMRSPLGRPTHMWGSTGNPVGLLLVYSPGEPMELARGGHSLTDLGFFPGDWSDAAKSWIVRRAAQGAVTDALVAQAALGTGPQSLWEACMDLATITPGVYTATERVERLEQLWSRGLRSQVTSPAPSRAYVVEASMSGVASAVLCHDADESYLVDASSGDRIGAAVPRPAQVEALWLVWSGLSYRVESRSLHTGPCEGEAFDDALAWIDHAKAAYEASVDRSSAHVWASGVRNEWVPVHAWVSVPESEAWAFHRDHARHLELWCETGIALGTLSDGQLVRPELRPYCSDEQWQRLSEAARNAPPVTSALSATNWDDDATWFARMYQSPFKSLAEILGCEPTERNIAASLARPVGERVKKPWPPSVHPRILPHPPCPAAQWPPADGLHWWPAHLSTASSR